MIDEVEHSEDRSQEMYERFLVNRNDLEEAIVSAHGKNGQILSNLLNLLIRKADENDMENW
ncbi:hypothetical protein [Lutibacter citreus]|uniref:hypothetical protein n=1 Tax=Lutibacter citreus TaxID=2138210 RepID=UPI0013007155|nr:hypothetical protein [Lutibacter citreus]